MISDTAPAATTPLSRWIGLVALLAATAILGIIIASNSANRSAQERRTDQQISTLLAGIHKKATP